MAQWDFYYHFARICLHSCFGSAIPDYLTAWTIQVLEERHPTSDYPNQVLCSHGKATEQCHRVWIQGRVALSNSFMLILQCGITCFQQGKEVSTPAVSTEEQFHCPDCTKLPSAANSSTRSFQSKALIFQK